MVSARQQHRDPPATLVLYGIYLLRKIITGVIAGRPFSAANVRRIRLLAILAFAVSILRPTVEYLVARTVLSRLGVENPPLSAPFDLS